MFLLAILLFLPFSSILSTLLTKVAAPEERSSPLGFHLLIDLLYLHNWNQTLCLSNVLLLPWAHPHDQGKDVEKVDKIPNYSCQLIFTWLWKSVLFWGLESSGVNHLPVVMTWTTGPSIFHLYEWHGPLLIYSFFSKSTFTLGLTCLLWRPFQSSEHVALLDHDWLII